MVMWSAFSGHVKLTYAIISQKPIVMQSHWCESPYGAFILQQEAKLLQQALAVAAANNVALVCESRALPILTAKSFASSQPNVFAAQFSNAHLSDTDHDQNIETSSVDWLILWHALEQQHDPRILLREVTRVLSDGGRVSIFGFNPVRTLSRKFWFWKDKSPASIQSQLLQFRLHDWLRVLNFDVTQIHTLISPNLSRLQWHRDKCSDSQRVHTFPLLGLVYHFEAVRRHFPMTPLRTNKGREKKRNLQLVSSANNGRAAKLMKPDNNKKPR